MFTDDTSVLKPHQFGALAKQSKIASARIEAGSDGLIVVARTNDAQERILGVARGGKRIFQSIDGAASVLQKYGIFDFDCKIENWIPKTAIRGYRTMYNNKLSA